MSIFQYNICRFGSFDKGVAAWFNDTLFKKKSGRATEIFLATKSRPQRCLNKYKEELNLQRTINSSTVLILSFKYTIPSTFCTNILSCYKTCRLVVDDLWFTRSNFTTIVMTGSSVITTREVGPYLRLHFLWLSPQIWQLLCPLNHWWWRSQWFSHTEADHVAAHAWQLSDWC